MKRTTKLTTGFLGACVLASSNLYAAESAGATIGAGTGFKIGGEGIPVGGGSVIAYPSMDVGLNHEGNIYSTDSNEKSSWVMTISPGIKFETKHRANTYAIAYRADITRFLSSSVDNTVEHDLAATADLSLSSKAGLKLKAQYLQGADRRGSTDREADPTEVKGADEWHSFGVGGVFAYGSTGAKGRIELEADHVRKRYDTNRTVTKVADVDESTLGATFFWRVAPKTSALFQVQWKDFEYVSETTDNITAWSPGVPPSSVAQCDPAAVVVPGFPRSPVECPSQDSQELRYSVGVTWDATAKTTGIAKIGYLKKDFDSNLREDFSGVAWEVAMNWRPKTYSNFNFTTGREAEESTGVGDTIVRTHIGAAWNHKWNGRFATTANIEYAENDYESKFNPIENDREDDVTSVSIGGMYQFRRWLGIGPNYTYTNTDSNISTEDSSDSIVGVSFKLAL